eukprot:Nitzschia sp. Nitz4//scaffold56_size114212//15959//16603//NITZ4_003934-RA/size114212-processed-gene-0.32-mRNA-1//1//CDS//3329554658//6734//frame0
MNPNPRRENTRLKTFETLNQTLQTASHASSRSKKEKKPKKNDDNFVVMLPVGYEVYPQNEHRSNTRIPIARTKATDLGTNFVPSRFDVLCSRGKLSWNHEGNVFFRKLVKLNAQRYETANSRLQRSVVVSALVDCIRSRATGFVKQEPKSGMWTEVGDELAREKVGQLMRNILGGFRSSLKSKTAKRKVTLTKMAKPALVFEPKWMKYKGTALP